MRDSSPAGARNPRIVVLGAGYAGLTCFLELQDHLHRSAPLRLVNADRFHWLTTELHTYVAGEPAEAVRIPLTRVVTPPGRLEVGRVDRVDLAGRRVQLEGGKSLPYDLLVFGLGSDPEYFSLPGVAEHSLVVGNWQGATRVRERVQALVDRPGPPPHVVVAGGGLTGVEVVGELADEHGGRVRLTLVEAGPEIMGGFAPDLVAISREVLEAKAITIRTGNPITSVEPGLIHFKEGEPLRCDLLVWAGGVRGSGVLAKSGLAVTPRGRARVDQFLRAEEHPEVYVVGDSAAFTDPATGKEVPPTAQAAVQMGRAVGRNILRRLRGEEERPFLPQIRGAFASLGRTAGVGQVGQERYAGLPAVLVKQAIEAHHAWEAGSGLLPFIGRFLRVPRRFLVRPFARPAIFQAPERAGEMRPEPRH